MSENAPQKKNPYKARREAIARALRTWQQGDGSDSGHELGDATALEDCLLDEGLALMPRSTGHGKWVVEVDGQRAPFFASKVPSGLLDAEEAADLFLTLSAADEYAEHQPTIRPATEMEFKTALASHLFGGAA
ncbi:hypothetical protein [Nonomuraea sp. NPDC023979]|uniref:hypothetical protein n=1 Tax=Nonomuraea sp. NPDC023979 TaxID=3154796 RepID=UPI0033E36BDC